MELVFLTLVLTPLGLYLSCAWHEMGHWLFAKMIGGSLLDLRIGGGQRMFGGKVGATRWGVGSHPFGGLTLMGWPTAGKNVRQRQARNLFMALGGPLASAILCIAMVLTSVPAEVVPAWCIVLSSNLWQLWQTLKRPGVGKFNDGVAIMTSYSELQRCREARERNRNKALAS